LLHLSQLYEFNDDILYNNLIFKSIFESSQNFVKLEEKLSYKTILLLGISFETYSHYFVKIKDPFYFLLSPSKTIGKNRLFRKSMFRPQKT
jgi:hypothetical protein